MPPNTQRTAKVLNRAKNISYSRHFMGGTIRLEFLVTSARNRNKLEVIRAVSGTYCSFRKKKIC